MTMQFNDERELRLYADRKRREHERKSGKPHPKSLDELVETIRPIWSRLPEGVRRTLNHFSHKADVSKRRASHERTAGH